MCQLSFAMFLACFVFYGFCIFNTISPMALFIDEEISSGRRLQNADSSSQQNCTPQNAGLMSSVGAVAGAALTGAAFLAIGLSPIGPIAGGLFAANMGAGLATGSFVHNLL
jgi:hypothetical protein